MVRASSDTRAIDHLDVERVTGDITDRNAIASAMAGCDSVFYCIVDTRAWLRDPAPLYRTNVEGLRTVMDMALDADIKRFVFTSTFGTIGINPSGVSTEQDKFNWWDKAPDYIRCRVQAEDLFMEYCRDKGLPGVACCVGNTYGGGDIAPTPHGKLVKDVAAGRMPLLLGRRWPLGWYSRCGQGPVTGGRKGTHRRALYCRRALGWIFRSFLPARRR